jgi:hypothetical protein
VSVASGSAPALVFTVAMVAGMALYEVYVWARSAVTSRAERRSAARVTTA